MMGMPTKATRRALLLSRSLSLHHPVKQRNVSSIVSPLLCDWLKEKRGKNTPSLPRVGRRCLSSGGWSGVRGHDITMESLKFGSRPKVILEGYTPVGFHVYNTIMKTDQHHHQEQEDGDGDGSFHLHGSIMAFPFGCFLWKVSTAKDITLETLYPVLLHRPAIELLFIGCDKNQQIPAAEMNRIRLACMKRNIVVEKTSVGNAMGTFNILNAEDRNVAVVLLVATTDDD
jgi:uncharacterized protein